MRTFQLNRSDGGVSICHADDTTPIADIIQKWEDVHLGVTITSNEQITLGDVPADRTYRDAWRPQ